MKKDSDKTSDKLVKWILNYEAKLTEGFNENAWSYFEGLKLHPFLNGYRCSRCYSINAVKNKEGMCIKCLVIREKLDVLDKILKELKGGYNK